MSNNVKEVNGKELKELVAAGGAVVCDFWASWCGPCRMLGPVMDKMAQEFAGRAAFVKVNVDDNEEIARELGIMSIPDVYVFADGVVKTHHLGFVPEEMMRSFLTQNLG